MRDGIKSLPTLRAKALLPPVLFAALGNLIFPLSVHTGLSKLFCATFRTSKVRRKKQVESDLIFWGMAK